MKTPNCAFVGEPQGTTRRAVNTCFRNQGIPILSAPSADPNTDSLRGCKPGRPSRSAQWQQSDL